MQGIAMGESWLSGGGQESTGYWNFPCGNIRESSPGTVSLEVGAGNGKPDVHDAAEGDPGIPVF